MRPTVAVVGRGVAVALAVAVPAALAAQVLEAVTDDDPGLLAYPLSLLVLTGAALGGWAVGREAPGRSTGLGAAAGFVAIAIVQVLGVVRRSAAGHDVAWRTVPAVSVVAVGLATAGAALGARRPGRTRP